MWTLDGYVAPVGAAENDGKHDGLSWAAVVLRIYHGQDRIRLHAGVMHRRMHGMVQTPTCRDDWRRWLE